MNGVEKFGLVALLVFLHNLPAKPMTTIEYVALAVIGIACLFYGHELRRKKGEA